MTPQRGEVWMFDCGMVEKVRPVLVLSIPFGDSDRAVFTVVFHSTALRGSAFEVRLQVPFLKEGAFIAQSIATYPTARAIRKLGTLNPRNSRPLRRRCSDGLGKRRTRRRPSKSKSKEQEQRRAGAGALVRAVEAQNDSAHSRPEFTW